MRYPGFAVSLMFTSNLLKAMINDIYQIDKSHFFAYYAKNSNSATCMLAKDTRQRQKYWEENGITFENRGKVYDSITPFCL